MSPSASPRPTAPDPATRQQLDELDALLQRMLALPVTPADEPTDPPADAPERPATPAPAAVLPPAPPAPEPASWEFGAPTLEGFPEPVPPPVVPAPAAIVTSISEPPPPPVPPPLSLWLLPLVLGNGAFDLCTYPLGPVGRWLRAPGGRLVLGVAGWLLLVAAAAWAACDLTGWRF